MVVLAIIALVATIATPQILRSLDSARADTARTQIRNIASALELYYIDNGRYPAVEEGIGALAIAPQSARDWNGPYLKRADELEDPWGRKYDYELDGNTFVVRSYGRDGKPGGSGVDADLQN
jgi:general secretion pathway protein G